MILIIFYVLTSCGSRISQWDPPTPEGVNLLFHENERKWMRVPLAATLDPPLLTVAKFNIVQENLVKISPSWSHLLKNPHKILLTSCTPLSTSAKRLNSLKLLIWTSSDRPRMAARDERNQAQKRRRSWLEFYIQSPWLRTQKNTWLPVYVGSPGTVPSPPSHWWSVLPSPSRMQCSPLSSQSAMLSPPSLCTLPFPFSGVTFSLVQYSTPILCSAKQDVEFMYTPGGCTVHAKWWFTVRQQRQNKSNFCVIAIDIMNGYWTHSWRLQKWQKWVSRWPIEVFTLWQQRHRKIFVITVWTRLKWCTVQPRGIHKWVLHLCTPLMCTGIRGCIWMRHWVQYSTFPQGLGLNHFYSIKCFPEQHIVIQAAKCRFRTSSLTINAERYAVRLF